jgi:hypothetical protein
VGDLIKKMQLHGEIAYWDTLPSSFDDYLRYVAGFNYTFNNVIFDHDIILLFEYLNELTTHSARETGVEDFANGLSAPLAGLVGPLLPTLAGAVADARKLQRGLRGSFLSRVTYQFSDNLKFELTGIAVTHGPDSYFLRSELIFDMLDNVRVAGGYEYFAGSRDGFFGRHKKHDRFIFEARYSF